MVFDEIFFCYTCCEYNYKVGALVITVVVGVETRHALTTTANGRVTSVAIENHLAG